MSSDVNQSWLLNEQFHNFMIAMNLAVQFLILLLILLGLRFKRKKNYDWHGNEMLVAVIVNLILFIMHMGPSLIGDVGREVVSQPFGLLSIAAILHGVFGGGAEILALWVVVSWAYLHGSLTKFCYRRRRVMALILRLWVIALMLGIIVFILHVVVEP